MRKVSAKEFFTVLWSGVCQVLGWFFGLFGYKRDGWFAKCVWGMFATSAAVITCIVASVLVYYACDDLWRSYGKRLVTCDDPECKANEYLSTRPPSFVFFVASLPFPAAGAMDETRTIRANAPKTKAFLGITCVSR